MYQITLTASERRAFDWVGNRYASGEIGDIISDGIPDDAEWDSADDITFNVPESAAWQIQELADEPDAFACFAPALVTKLYEFLEQIV